MANKTISGTLTIPASEPKAGSHYSDLTLELVFTDGSNETVSQTSTVSTSNQYSFTYADAGQVVLVRLKRISSGATLSESAKRGVLPRSFLLPKTDALYNGEFKNQNYLYDAGLSILASAGGKYFSLAKEITEGVIKAETTDGSLPFNANHVVPTGSTKEYRTGTIAMVAYSLGFYLEHNPLASNKAGVAAVLNDLLIWLCSQRKDTHGNLLTGGVGRYTGSTFNPTQADDVAYTADNILAYFAFKQASVILNDVYLEVADELSASIMSNLYADASHKFITALHAGGVLATNANLETDVLGALFLISEDDLNRAGELMDRIESTYTITDTTNNVTAYKLTTTDTKVWVEGSYAAAIAHFKLGDFAKYNAITKSLNKLLNEDDGSFRFGVIKDGQFKVLDYKSVGATAWSYMANIFPETAFSINEAATSITGVVPVYINNTLASSYTKNDCGGGVQGSLGEYKVLPGKYHTLVSEDAADDMAQADADANGQAYVNAHGTCLVPYTYHNTTRNGLFKSVPCGSGSTGAVYSYSVPAGAYGSNISQEHADALADEHLRTAGQAYANAQSTCVVDTHQVTITLQTSVNDNGSTDEVYATAYASEAIETLIGIDYEYSIDGATFVTGGTVAMLTGSSNTFAFYVTSVPVGSGQNVQVRIVDVSPDHFGDQLYQWNNNHQVYNNHQRSSYFIKDCGTIGIDVGSIILVTRPANLDTSFLSQEDADAKADKWIADHGQNVANAQGSCYGVTTYFNEQQSDVFQKQCGAGYLGTLVTYTVPANTYQSSVSVQDANNYALAEIAANGQSYANLNGICTLNRNSTIGISLQFRVDSFGLFDHVYVKAVASAPVTTDISVTYQYSLNGNTYLAFGPLTIPANSQQSAEDNLGQFNQGEGQNVTGQINTLTPTQHGGKNYIII